jgi:regulatory protein
MAREQRSLRSRALSLLARREHSRLELARKLAPHVVEGDNLDAVLDDLAAKGWLSDARFAEQSIRSKARRFGPRKLAYDLRSKGVDEEAIAWGMRAAGVDGISRIEDIWKSRFRAAPVGEREKARHARFLVGRGFGAEEAFRFLATLREAA